MTETTLMRKAMGMSLCLGSTGVPCDEKVVKRCSRSRARRITPVSFR